MAHSLPFVVWDERSNTFTINEDAARYLSQFDSPISVVIVAGRYRSGKSFLCNQLVGDAAGFSVGHTIASHTKGIWLAGEAIQAHNSDGKPVTLLIMDSEGLGATDKVRHPKYTRV